MAVKGASVGTSAYIGTLATQNLDAMLKNIELDIVNVVFHETPAFDAFGSEKLNWYGRRATFPIKTGMNGSFAGYAEGGILPEPGKSAAKECEVTQKSLAGQFALTGQAISNTKGDEGSLVRAINLEQESLIDGIKFNVERMLWGDGDGVIGKCLTYVANGGPDPDDGTVNMDATITNGYTNTTCMFDGMKVVWGTAAQLNAGTPAGYGYIDGVDDDDSFGLHTTGGIVPVNATDFFCLGTYNSAKAEYAISYAREFPGIRAMASATSTLQGLAVATSPFWIAKILQANAGGGNITLTDDLMIRALILYKRFYGGGRLPNMIWATPGMENELFKMMYTQRRFQPQEYKGGFRGDLEFTYGDATIPFHYADMAFRNELLFCRKEEIKYSFATPLGWLLGEFNGGRVLYLDTGYNQGIGAFGCDGTMLIKNRRSLLRLQEIACTDDFASPA